MGINGARSSVRPVQGGPRHSLAQKTQLDTGGWATLPSGTLFYFMELCSLSFSVRLSSACCFCRSYSILCLGSQEPEPRVDTCPLPHIKLHELPLPPAWVDAQHSLREGRNSSALSTLPNICLFVVCSLETGFLSSPLCSRHSNN